MGAAVVMAGCTQTLDMSKAQAAISDGLARQLGVRVVSVTCPESRVMKEADSFECQAVIDGGARLAIQVTQKDGEGNFNWQVARTEGLINLGAVEASIRNGLKEQAGMDAAVSCGGKYRSAQPGGTFECTATAGGTQATIVVTMKDLAGTISWEAVPRT
jgi:hypothetical protein